MLRKLAAYRCQNRLGLALQELGRLERTLFMLDWLESPELRRCWVSPLMGHCAPPGPPMARNDRHRRETVPTGQEETIRSGQAAR
jgi:hypothetical protein